MKKYLLFVFVFFLSFLLGCGNSPKGKWKCVTEKQNFGLIGMHSVITYDIEGDGSVTKITDVYVENISTGEKRNLHEKEEGSWKIDNDTLFFYDKKGKIVDKNEILTISSDRMVLADEKKGYKWEFLKAE
jgi:hypothetical protein